jgi:hypothetical protein
MPTRQFSIFELRFSIFSLLGLVALHFLTGQAPAAKVKVWNHHSPSDYDKAQLKQAVVSNEGVLRLSQELKPFANLDAAHVWDVVEDREGNLYAATGDDGKVYKVTPAGKASVAYAGDDSQVLCLALAPDGAVYAGTGPGGRIIRIAPDGTAKVHYQTPESYVWSLALNEKGDKLFAGTGPKGRIYSVSPEGKGSVFYTTKQEHILCMAMGAKDTLYAGTDKGGLVYRIDAQGKGFVLYSAPQSEVRSLLVTPAGVYAGTSAPVKRRGSSSGSSASDRPALSSGGLKAVPVSTTKPTEDKTAEEIGAPKSSSSSSSSDSKSNPAPAASPPSSGENCVFFIRPDGTVRELFREKALVLSLLKQDGRLLVGTGMEGQLFEVDEATKERTEIARLDHGQIHCLKRRRDGSIILGAGDPGKLYTLQDRHATKGTVVSEVLDAKIISKWGALRWSGATPTGTTLTVAARSGNVAEPDETWSDWSAEQSDGRQAQIVAPAARFLQYRVTLGSDNPAASPSLRTLAVRYATTNQAPEITTMDVPDLDAVTLENPKKLKFKWSATDANEDELTYTLLVRKDGWKDWVQLEDGLDKKDFEWDTTTAPSGIYRLKLVASDRKDNSAEEALTGERVSAPFVVSHAPPTVALKVVGFEGDRAVIEATATDAFVRLTGASFAVNGKKWSNVFPTDGLFDSKEERFRFTTDTLKPGSHVLVLKVSDASGNTGAADVMFTVPGK